MTAYKNALVTIAVVLALGATAPSNAFAILAPFDARPAVQADDHTTIDSGPAATLESKYFHAPGQPYAAGRLFPCVMQLRLFDKTRLARNSCN